MTLLSVPKSTPTTDMFIGDGGVSQVWGLGNVCARGGCGVVWVDCIVEEDWRILQQEFVAVLATMVQGCPVYAENARITSKIRETNC